VKHSILIIATTNCCEIDLATTMSLAAIKKCAKSTVNRPLG
jgi:hypothetical protein